MPVRSDEVFLTLELFSGTTSIMRDVLQDCGESVAYWRCITGLEQSRIFLANELPASGETNETEDIEVIVKLKKIKHDDPLNMRI